MSTPTPTPDPWIADGYDLRQKNGRMIAYFGPHHTPADEYPMSCRLQDEANCQWVAAARNELAAVKAECERLKFATEGHLLKTIQQQAELARLRAEVELLKVALTRAEACLMDIAKGAILTGENLRIWAETVSVLLPLEAEKARAALAATKEEIK